jgi:hypothetical protein
MEELKVRARRGELTFDPDSICLYAWRKDRKAAASVAQPMELKRHVEGERLEPFLSLGSHEAQKLMDELWDCGLRPSEGAGSAGAMRATEKHLEDMKIIAFHALKINNNKTN